MDCDTYFHILRPQPPTSFVYVEGRLTRRKKGTKPGNVWPETWQAYGKKAKQQAIERWENISKDRDKLQEQRQRHHILEAEVEDYNRIMAEVRKIFSVPAAPAMPLSGYICNSSTIVVGSSHQENIQAAGNASVDFLGLTSTLVPMQKALKIPAAKAAVEK